MTSSISHLYSYLTRSEQKSYTLLPASLQEELEQSFLPSKGLLNIESVRLVLDILKYQESRELETKEIFFLQILKSKHEDLIPYLTKLLHICQRGGEVGFFRCVSTKRSHYYPTEILFEVIETFDELAKSIGVSLAFLDPVPSYDEGGKEWLHRLKEDPSQLDKISFQKREEDLCLTPLLASGEKTILKRSDILNLCSVEALKREAIRYFSSLPETHRFPLRTYLDIFREIEYSFEIRHLGRMSQIALIQLIVLTTSRENECIEQRLSNGDIREFISEAKQFHQKWGEEVFLSFCHAPSLSERVSIDLLIRSLTLLNCLADTVDRLDSIRKYLYSFSTGSIDLTQLKRLLVNLAAPLDTEASLEEDIDELFIRFGGKDRNVSFPLNREQLQIVKKQYETILKYCEEWKEKRIGQLVEMAFLIRAKGSSLEWNEEDILKLLAIARLSWRLQFQIYPYSTQILTILGQLCFKKGAIAQVKTGEGKSLICSLLAFILVMQNKQGIHIVSSSRNLSIRDQKKAAPFFALFGITTSHICKDQAKPQRFQADILYGTASDFEFAVMRERLYSISLFRQIRKPDQQHRFDCVIIDELDNLTIDTASHRARLSYPKDENYDWVYIPVLNFAKDQQGSLSSSQIPETLRRYLQDYLDGSFREAALRLSDKQLLDWYESACTALGFEEKKDYILVEKERVDRDLTQAVVIVDAANTGRLVRGSRWSKGVHEFVEARHHIVPEQESLTPFSLSNAIFYKMHRSIFGMTGTLGSEDEREETKEIYGVPSFDVPTYRPLLRQDYPPRIVATHQYYLETIYESVTRCREQGRPILVLCQTISDSQILEVFLRERGISLEMLNEVQKKKEEEILANAGSPSAVTIATNTAGRGTDILLKESSKIKGGLHVLITFFPQSQRVEDQARGRAGRQGERGSSEIVICLEHLPFGSLLEHIDPEIHEKIMQYLHTQRIFRTRMMKQYHLCQASVERHCFTLAEQFLDQLERFHALMNEEAFLTSIAHRLSTRKIFPREFNLSQLGPKDRQLAESALELLSGKSTEPLRWKVLLKLIGNRVKDRAINNWSYFFYQEAEELDQDRFQYEAYLHAKLLEDKKQLASSLGKEEGFILALFQMLEKTVVQSQEEAVEEIKKNMTALYKKHCIEWERYLDISGSGLIQYLRNITQTTLKGI